MNQGLKHLLLFLATFVACTLAGAEWMFGRSFFYGANTMGWNEFFSAMQYSIPFLTVLTFHEFGHYITARHYKVDVSLPFYMPFWIGFLAAPSIGTFGAFIRIKERVKNRIQNFDIGIAGPLAGFVIALFVLLYGFTNLPPKEHIFQIHPEYEVFGEDFEQYVYEKDTFVTAQQVREFNSEFAETMPDTLRLGNSISIQLGGSILFDFFEEYVVPNDEVDRVPNPREMIHYPWLLAGFLSLLFTALNLLPIGQLDGGHVVYGLFGSKNHGVLSRVFFIILVLYSGIGIINPYTQIGYISFIPEIYLYIPLYIAFLYYMFAGLSKNWKNRLMWSVIVFAFQFLILMLFPAYEGYQGWMLFAFLIGRFLGLDYPSAGSEGKLNVGRQILGWIALIIFIISFSPQPLIVEGI